MQLVILHYHLNRGGVTSVIENHLRSLALLAPSARPTRVAVVFGGRAAAWNHDIAKDLPFELSLMAVPQLEYDHLRSGEGSLYEAMQLVLKEFPRDLTLLHVHNHSLGKNAEFSQVLCRLAGEGWRLLLQVHDFAEDLRPLNYQHMLRRAESRDTMQGALYPQARQIHYAVLNRRDARVLSDSGIAAERLHLLPNPVKPPPPLLDAQHLQNLQAELKHSLGVPLEHRLVLYPVRAIRRKNLGELLLWSLLAEATTFAVTLAPLNPQESATYEHWVEFAVKHRLPVQFDIANQTELSFEATYAASDAIITTSVAEGFGMVYLEATLFGRPLFGRSLPEVCSDFVAAGMQFPGLSDRMAIPANTDDLQAYRQSHARLIESLRKAYGLPAADHEAEQAVEPSCHGDTFDFGRLGSAQQQSFLRRVIAEPRLRSRLRELNPKVATIGASQEDTGIRVGVDCDTSANAFQRTLEQNRQVIADHYALDVIGTRLSGIYREVLAEVPHDVACQVAIAVAILNQFLHPSQMVPVRLES